MAETQITYIESEPSSAGDFLGEYWRYRDLLYFLTWRDVKVRYKQTLLGVSWAVLVPLTQMLIFGVIFGKVAKLPSNGLDPFVFYLCALVPWQFFANAITASSGSLVAQSNLLTKVYFPRLFIPVSACVASGIDFAISFAMMLLVILGFGIVPADTLILTLPIIGLFFLNAVGAGTLFAALAVRYRDIRFVVPVLVQIWMYASVLLPFSQLPESWGVWRYLYALNPLVGEIEAFRWCLVHHEMIDASPPLMLLALGMPATVMLLVVGLRYFHRMERKFADVV